MIAALFVAKNGCYFGLDDVDPWDEERDARTYAGPHPVVAHPPCQRWCRLAGLVEARWGHKRGEDEGCFESALSSVRAYGGVLEHPAYSGAWKAFGLPRPEYVDMWTPGRCGGYSCYVEQSRYGHAAKKATWLYAFGIAARNLPSLCWGRVHDSKVTATVSWCGNRTVGGAVRRRIGKEEARATPIEFRDLLIRIAESASARKAA